MIEAFSSKTEQMNEGMSTQERFSLQAFLPDISVSVCLSK